MAYDGWICFGGVDVVNNCRTVDYAAGGITGDCLACVDIPGGCGCCEVLHADEVWTDPATDEAPWYDPNVPESVDFYGVLVTEVTGLEPGPIVRSTSPRASGSGSVPGRAVQASPVVTVSATLLAATEAAADYGLRWLRGALRGPCGTESGCGGTELVFYTSCPPLDSPGELPDYSPPDSDPWCDLGFGEGPFGQGPFGGCQTSPGDSPGESPGDSPGDDPLNHHELYDYYRRTFYEVVTSSSPEVLQQWPMNDGGADCGVLYDVEWQWTANEPCQYTEPTVVAQQVPFLADESDECRFEWLSPSEATGDCPEDLDCAADPNCGRIVKPPQPSTPSIPCATCDPWEIATGAVTLSNDIVPSHAEGVIIMTLRAGRTPLRGTKVRLWLNPQEAWWEDLDPCDACAEFTISRIPAWSVLVLDGRTRTATLFCEDGSPVDASSLLAAGGGTLPFSWPVFECPNVPWTVVATTDADVYDPEFANYDLSLVSREC